MAAKADPLDAARRHLYRLPPEQFTQARARLAAETDDPQLAAGIAALRKHSLAAWIVNASVGDDTIAELLDLGDRLARAQAELRADVLRELTLQRRRTVARLTDQALHAAGRTDASPTLRDSVSHTFDAAVADPAVAHALGGLLRPERWSGFGAVAPAALTVVEDEADTGQETDTAEHEAPEPRDRAERAAYADAEQEVADAEAAEQQLRVRLRRLTTRLTTLQHEIIRVRDDLDEATRRSAAATRQRRVAQADLDRVSRHSVSPHSVGRPGDVP